MAEDLLASFALILELGIRQALDMAVDIAAVLHHVVTLHGRHVFARVVVVRATIDTAVVAVCLFVVAVRDDGARFRDFHDLAGIVAAATVPDMSLLRRVVQLVKRRQDNTFTVCTMPVTDGFVTGGASHDFVVAVVVVQLFPPPRAGLGAINLRHVHVIVACVHGGRGTELSQIGLATSRLGFVTRFRKGGQQHGRQNGDDRDDDEQFNQRKLLLHVRFLLLMVYWTNGVGENLNYTSIQLFPLVK